MSIKIGEKLLTGRFYR